MKSILLFSFIILIIQQLSGQAELRKITPLSPNASSIAKYGEIPVSNFTGIPNISIPIYNIKSRELELPLSISYHAGGNKVEDIASWVGLGWSLGSIPSISRGVRGLEDEGANGYFSLYSGKTVKEIYDERGTTQGAILYNMFIGEAKDGSADAEPDIFSYSLSGKSGKFYFNQETQQFHTFPHENIQIQKLTSGFRIVSDDGVIYDFTQVESSTNDLQQSLNSWWASKIVNANRTDSILFDYNTDIELFTSISSVSRSVYVTGDADCNPPGYVSNTASTQIMALKPFQISFSLGYVKFIAQTNTRSDLAGSHALDRIEIYDYDSNLIRKFKFSYHYIGNLSGNEDEQRLVLDSMWEMGSSSVGLPAHKFIYENSISVPSRLSPAQDYWGFYNGATTNIDLVPPIFLGSGRMVTGANRLIDPVFNQFAILKQIIYPTGGSTSFEYESNWVDEPQLPTEVFINKAETITGPQTPPGNTAYYDRDFIIDVPANTYLNDNQGGAYVKIEIGSIGCDISGGQNLCANLIITGQSQHNSNISIPVIQNVDGVYLPNGAYKMSAEFNQDPPLYGNFF